MRRYLLPVALFVLSPLTIRAQSPENAIIDEVTDAIVTGTNDFRRQNGLAAVVKDEHLSKAASEFAEFMAESGKYGHHADGSSPAQRAKDAGYQYCVVRENIAYRTNSGDVTADSLIEVFVQGWIDSPPHRENMLADYVTQTGVAVATSDGVTFYAVQLFGRPKSEAIRLQVTNRSDQTRTLVLGANGNEDEVELPPRAIVKMTRCFPTTLSLADSDSQIQLTESAELTINEDGLNR